MPRGLQESSAAGRLLNELIIFIEDWDDYSRHPTAILYAGGIDAYREKRAWRREKERQQALRRLEKQKFLTIKTRGTKIFVELTDKGFAHALKNVIASRPGLLPVGQFCYVSFDIPQHVGRLRTLLRSLLKDAQFKMTHQSLWSTRRAVGKEFALLVRQLKAEDWIHVYIGQPLTKT